MLDSRLRGNDKLWATRPVGSSEGIGFADAILGRFCIVVRSEYTYVGNTFNYKWARCFGFAG